MKRFLSLLLAAASLAAAQLDSSAVPEARNNAPHIRIQADIGHAWFLMLDRDRQDSWRGLDMHFAAGWYVSPHVAVGAAYDHFGSRVTTRLDFSEPIDDRGNRSVEISETVALDFVGPSLLFRNKLNRWLALSGGLAVGYLRFETPTELYMNASNGVVVKPAVSSGGSLGMIPHAGLEIVLTPEIAIGFDARFVYGTISKFEVVPDSGSSTYAEGDNFSRVSVGGGVRFDL